MHLASVEFARLDKENKMNSDEQFPEEWKTNKNLRWWLMCQPNHDIVYFSDDRFIHESIAVEFAKQFHADELAQKDAEIERLKIIEKAVSFVYPTGGAVSMVGKIDDLEQKLSLAVKALEQIDECGDCGKAKEALKQIKGEG